jgi:hypothetical protein
MYVDAASSRPTGFSIYSIHPPANWYKYIVQVLVLVLVLVLVRIVHVVIEYEVCWWVGWWRVGTFHFPSRSAEVLTALLAYSAEQVKQGAGQGKKSCRVT